MRTVKDKLPAGVSYALKPSVLESAMQDASIATAATLYQWRDGWTKGGILFRADFYPAGRWFRNQDERLTITSRAIPSQFRAQARAYIEAVAIPEFIEWIARLERLPPDSTVRREKQELVRHWVPEETIDEH